MNERQDESPSPQQTEGFVRLLASHSDELYRFIYSLVPHHADAEDLLQQVSVVLWNKFSSFEPGTSFLRWAMQVARLEVLDYFKRRGRDRIGFWPTELVDAIADCRMEATDDLEEKRRALRYCITLLNEKDKKLIQLRYTGPGIGSTIAASVGRSVDSVYTALTRIRRRLLDCVTRRVSLDHRGMNQ